VLRVVSHKNPHIYTALELNNVTLRSDDKRVMSSNPHTFGLGMYERSDMDYCLNGFGKYGFRIGITNDCKLQYFRFAKSNYNFEKSPNYIYQITVVSKHIGKKTKDIHHSFTINWIKFAYHQTVTKNKEFNIQKIMTNMCV
jgi:hypothetical protein